MLVAMAEKLGPANLGFIVYVICSFGPYMQLVIQYQSHS
jgi:hypothetical protein